MRASSILRWLGAVALVSALAACGGGKKDVYVEKPVDDLYNKAMDEMVEERYAAAAKTFDEHAVHLAVIAHIRHRETNYDQLLGNGWPRHDARTHVRNRVDEIAESWK